MPYKWKNVVVLGGGFVSGIVFSPVEKDLIYARTDVGGAYRWNQADKTWIPLNDDLPRDSNFLGIESMAADPVDANKVYLAVGTYTGSWVGNGAILRSNDKGNTWNTVDMPIKMGGNENGRSMGERLAIDPNQPSILYFGSRKNGLWKSTDSGAKWDKVASFTASDGDKGIGIPLVFFDKKSGAKGKPTPDVYAAVANNDGSLYRSTDAGATWKLVPKQPTGVMASHAEFDSAGMLYVSYGNGPGPNDISDGAVWKFEPKTEKFTNITPLKPTADDKFGYGGLSVDAAHPGTLMVSTIDRWSKGDEIYRSTDGGKKWKPLLPKVVRDDAGAKYLYWHKDEPIGRGWMGDIAIDPFNPGRVMYVTGAGIWAQRRRQRRGHGQAHQLDVPQSRARRDGHQGAGQPAGRPAAAQRDGRPVRLPARRPERAVGRRHVRQSGVRLGEQHRHRVGQAGASSRASAGRAGTARGRGARPPPTAARRGRRSRGRPRARARDRSRWRPTGRRWWRRRSRARSCFRRTRARPGRARRGCPTRRNRPTGRRCRSGRPPTA